MRAVPYATYYVDGELRAEKQARMEIQLPPGRHHIRAVHPWFDPVNADVMIEPRHLTPWVHSFPVHERGSIKVDANQASELWVDGKQEGEAPGQVDGLRPGPHTVELRLDGFEMDKGPQLVDVHGGAVSAIKVKLKKRRN